MDMKASFILKHKAVFLQLQKKFKEMSIRIYTKKKKKKRKTKIAWRNTTLGIVQN